MTQLMCIYIHIYRIFIMGSIGIYPGIGSVHMRVIMRVFVGVASRARVLRRIHRMKVRVRSILAPFGVCLFAFVFFFLCACLFAPRFPTFADVGRMSTREYP